jgi:hypothetical protein
MFSGAPPVKDALADCKESASSGLRIPRVLVNYNENTSSAPDAVEIPNKTRKSVSD